MTETNLEQIKAISKRLLEVEINKTDYWPAIAQHPFTNTGAYFWKDENGGFQNGILERGTEAYKKWKEKCTELIDRADKVLDIYFILNKPWAMYFIRLIESHLSDEDFAMLFKDAFTEMEQPNMDSNVSIAQLKKYFKRCDKSLLMDEDELEVYNSLPDVVTVYRGVTSYNNKKLKVLSWTTSLDVAKWFANRFDQHGQVYTAIINKKYIFAYFDGRDEFEVIVDPSKLKDIELYLDLSKIND